jgi:stalled ribosome alternative rescue factor ArfA
MLTLSLYLKPLLKQRQSKGKQGKGLQSKGKSKNKNCYCKSNKGFWEKVKINSIFFFPSL